mmetsp:Transcript_8403/g.21419  ORF Transcript_8403/g.21419 Transcript_8403/m.21419 type:complete len:396 (-) Transcript_8403:131-1318(-)
MPGRAALSCLGAPGEQAHILEAQHLVAPAGPARLQLARKELQAARVGAAGEGRQELPQARLARVHGWLGHDREGLRQVGGSTRRRRGAAGSAREHQVLVRLAVRAAHRRDREPGVGDLEPIPRRHLCQAPRSQQLLIHKAEQLGPVRHPQRHKRAVLRRELAHRQRQHLALRQRGVGSGAPRAGVLPRRVDHDQVVAPHLLRLGEQRLHPAHVGQQEAGAGGQEHAAVQHRRHALLQRAAAAQHAAKQVGRRAGREALELGEQRVLHLCERHVVDPVLLPLPVRHARRRIPMARCLPQGTECRVRCLHVHQRSFAHLLRRYFARRLRALLLWPLPLPPDTRPVRSLATRIRAVFASAVRGGVRRVRVAALTAVRLRSAVQVGAGRMHRVAAGHGL